MNPKKALFLICTCFLSALGLNLIWPTHPLSLDLFVGGLLGLFNADLYHYFFEK